MLKKVVACDNGGENEFDIVDEHHIEYAVLNMQLGETGDDLEATGIEFEGTAFFEYQTESAFQMIEIHSKLEMVSPAKKKHIVQCSLKPNLPRLDP